LEAYLRDIIGNDALSGRFLSQKRGEDRGEAAVIPERRYIIMSV